MALIRSYVLPGDITIDSAYYVVTHLNATKILRELVPPEPVEPVEPIAPPPTEPVEGEEAVVTPIPEPEPAPEPVYVLSQKWACVVTVSVFKDRATREMGGQPFAYITSVSPNSPVSTEFTYDPSGPLPIIQAYIHLMAQPYFAGAEVDTAS